MTINTSIRKAGPYAGNGIATVFPFDFKVFEPEDLRVVYADAAGLEVDLALGADYAVTMNPNQDANPGGTVILAEPLETGARLTVTSSLEYLQATELTNAGGFYPRVLNDTHDRLVIYIQQLAEEIGRTLKSSITSPTSGALPAPTPQYLIGWNSDGTGFANYPQGGGVGGSGTVTSVSVVAANGLTGTVANATTEPEITLGTTITGIAKAFSGAFVGAVAGLDYVPPGLYASDNGLTMGSNKLLGRSSAGTGAAQEITIGAGLALSSGVLSASGGGAGGSGTVTSVSVVAANGLTGTVANATTEPEITLGTSIPNGMVKAVLGSFSAASAGTDYIAPGSATGSGLTMATNKLIGRSSSGSGALEEVTIGPGLSLSSGTLTAVGGVALPLKLITEFGAVPNTGVDNTAAFQAAMDWIIANKRPVFIPAGQWLTQAITLYTGSNQDWCGFVGEDPKTTIVAYYGTTPANTAMITVGSPSMATYIGNLRFANITFQANGSNANATPFRIYDLAWTTFDNCNFQGGDIAFDCLGGVNITFEQCGFQYAASTGLRIDKFTRAGGGWPNNIKVVGGVAGANGKVGISFDYGRQLILDGVQIEGNGSTAGSATHGGLIVGTNIGAETGTQATNAHLGVVGCNIWFEQNTGIADAYLQSGLNTLTGCLFWSQPSIVTNNVRITGQKYSLVNCDFSQTSFTVGQPNVFEGASVLAGNTVIGGDVPKISWNNQKTTLLIDNAMFSPVATIAGPISGASTISAGSSITAGTNITASGTIQGANVTATGAVSGASVTATGTVSGANVTASSTVSGANVNASTNVAARSLNIGPLWNALNGTTPTKPLILFGYDATSATPTISFGKTMANNGTVVIVQPVAVADTYLRAPLVTGVTTTGFTVTKERITGTTKSTENYGIYWIAIGEEA